MDKKTKVVSPVFPADLSGAEIHKALPADTDPKEQEVNGLLNANNITRKIIIPKGDPAPLHSEPSIDDKTILSRIPGGTSLEVVSEEDLKQGKALIRFYKVEYKGKTGWVNEFFTGMTVTSENKKNGEKSTEESPGKNGVRVAVPTEKDKAREKELNSFFSAWDGSNTKVIAAVKEKMNDPGSFEHVSTKFWDTKDCIEVIMEYRGKNIFGGVVTNTVEATLSLDGETLLSLKDM